MSAGQREADDRRSASRRSCSTARGCGTRCRWRCMTNCPAACGRIASTPGLARGRCSAARTAPLLRAPISASFAGFTTGEDGVRYEARLERGVGEVEALPVPTLAVIDGPATGGGLMIATACDLRVASSRARFGVPVARTLGNCLSRANLMRLERAFGQGRTHRMLLLADLLDANEALAAGFLVAMPQPGRAGNPRRRNPRQAGRQRAYRLPRRARSCASLRNRRRKSSPASMAAETSKRASSPFSRSGRRSGRAISGRIAL